MVFTDREEQVAVIVVLDLGQRTLVAPKKNGSYHDGESQGSGRRFYDIGSKLAPMSKIHCSLEKERRRQTKERRRGRRMENSRIHDGVEKVV